MNNAGTAENAVTHEPVLLNEVLNFLREHLLQSQTELVILDGTLGLGGYSEAILSAFPNSKVLGLDRDSNAIARAEQRLASFSSFNSSNNSTAITAPRFAAIHANFSDAAQVWAKYAGAYSKAQLDATVLDLGVSNMQLTEPERGFSFQQDGPLDMRMDPESSDMTATDVLAQTDEQELTRIFRDYGDERYARRIASGIVTARKAGEPLSTTSELVALIRRVLPAPVQRKMGTHPARRVFQALRIFVNNELSELEAVLDALPGVMAPGGLVIIVSYHSLEDRLVKHRFRTWDKELGLGKVLTRHPVLPQEDEIERNYKARSAKLRAFKFYSYSSCNSRGGEERAKAERETEPGFLAQSSAWSADRLILPCRTGSASLSRVQSGLAT